ncbi:hypothetical protein NIES25_00460 [Nostoc linckia NIES-25]|nr:hypothetical protein NIES25_00460 [Nostoc linckia NIES-25]
MEHWQFLIQKQGDRSWHILESPNSQILEGQYRVLARSNLLNTDVEVRVTHFSTHEVTPKRRIFKRSRRTNSEGLMAVIPFTDFEPGVWELRCSGDLMSDMLGKSWQYSVQVQVLCQEIEAAGGAQGQGSKGEVATSLYLMPLPDDATYFKSASPNAVAPTFLMPHDLQPVETLEQAIAISTELPIPTDSSADTPVVSDAINEEEIASSTVTNVVPDVTQPEDRVNGTVIDVVADATQEESIFTTTDTAIVIDVAQAEYKASSIDTPVVADVTQEEDIFSHTDTPIVADVTQEEDIFSRTDRPIVADATQEEDIFSHTDTPIVADVTQEEDIFSDADTPIVADATQEEDIFGRTDTPIVADVTQEEDIFSDTDTAIVADATQEENIAIDRPIGPVWLKGETVEQILQNLIELALPTPEPLSEDEKVIHSSETQQLPPLLLTLDRDTYIARWGQALTINGRVELEEKTNLELAETLSAKSVRGLELKIELRSPLESQILTQLRQPLPDRELPFNINTSIDIPAECESKLILADISLYGKFTETSEVTQLANQSFTITADVTELLTITAATKSSTSSNQVIAASASSTNFTQPQATVKLDLKLLNLVKVRKTDDPAVANSSPNLALPAQINVQVPREAARRTSQLKNSASSPQLPKLPPIQTDVNTPTDVVAESTLQNELLEKDATIAAINLEQLVIKQRRIPILDTTFPYLKRLQSVSNGTEEVKDNPLDTLEIQAAEDTPQLDAIIDEDKNIAQVLAQPNSEVQQESVAQIPTQPNSEVQEESITQVLYQPNLEVQEESVAQIPTQPNLEVQEESITQVLSQPNSEFIKTKLYSSPLLKKWMHSQGYSFPEPVNELPSQDYDNYLPEPQVSLSPSAETLDSDVDTVDANLLLSSDANTEILEDTDAVEKVDLVIQENTVIEEILEEPTFSPPLRSQIPPPPPPINRNTASAWLAEEIVVDDTYSELDVDATESYVLEGEEQLVSDLSHLLAISMEAIEPLPIPQLYVPEGELIAGKSVIVRVVMPEVARQLAIKLWVEDCQTRWLLDGPHLLTNLLPNSLGGLEVMTQLNIPFGCLEIRLEAIALDPVTQQESHKVTTVRTVIPPDLPNLELDELLGI